MTTRRSTVNNCAFHDKRTNKTSQSNWGKKAPIDKHENHHCSSMAVVNTMVQEQYNPVIDPSFVNMHIAYTGLLVETTAKMLYGMHADCYAADPFMPHYNAEGYNNNTNYYQQQSWVSMDYAPFIQSVFKRGKMTYSIVIIGLLYLTRFRMALVSRANCGGSHSLERSRRRADFVPRIFLTSLLLSTKFLCDRHDSNRMWAATHQLSLSGVNQAETMFLDLIDFRLNVSARSFASWMAKIFNQEAVQAYTRPWPIHRPPPTPPYHLDDLYEQKLKDKRKRLERAV